MKIKHLLLTSLLAGLCLASQLAQAHPPGGRWHGGVGVYFGSPYPFHAYPYGYPYGYPYAYGPPPVIIAQPPQPQVYIEQGSGATTPAQVAPPAASAGNNNAQGYWYYCEQADGYYPYVKECPAGWKQVTPSPPPASSAK